MDSRLSGLKWLPRLAVAMLTVSAVEARPPATNGWQKIVFSSPANTQISSNLTSVTSPSPFSAIENRLQLFQDSSPVAAFATPPPAAPLPMPGQMQRFQKSPDGNLAWEFMTPAEILGVAPDQILHITRRDGQGDRDSLTPMERYLQGQSSFGQFQTNSAGNSFREQNFWANGNNQTNGASRGLLNRMWDNLRSKASSPFLGNTPANSWSGSRNEDSFWPRMFGSPTPQPASNHGQQQSAMSQYIQLLNRGSAPVTADATPEEAPSFKPQTALPDSDSGVPSANPFGVSVAPLSSGISKPVGLAPLPSLIQPAAAQPPAPPAWAPQPPPWLSSMPQPFTVPQRKF